MEEYVKHIEEEHGKQHTGMTNVDFAYDQTNCVLNATDIMLDQMMYSVPATQVWAGIKNAEDKVTKLDNALRAMIVRNLCYRIGSLIDIVSNLVGNAPAKSRPVIGSAYQSG